MGERSEVPSNICSECYRQLPQHAPDCRRGRLATINTKEAVVVGDTPESQKAELLDKIGETVGRDETGAITEQHAQAVIRAKMEGLPEEMRDEPGTEEESYFPDEYPQLMERINHATISITKLKQEIAEHLRETGQGHTLKTKLRTAEAVFDQAWELFEEMTNNPADNDQRIDVIKQRITEVENSISEIYEELMKSLGDL